MIHFRHSTKLTTVGGAYQDEVSGASFREAKPFSGPTPPPLPLRFNVFVEGVDDPFRTRWRFSTGQERRKLTADWRRLVSGSVYFGFPIPILNTPPDELPLRIARLGEVSRGNWKRERDALELARRSGPTRNVTFFAVAADGTYSGTACELFAEIQRHLLEDPIDNGLTWSLWSLEEALSSINDRMNRFNQLTGIIRQRASISFTAGQVESDQLPTDLLQLRRAVWNTGSARGVLTPEDTYSLDHGTPGWQTETGVPKAIVKEPLERLKLRPYPTPALAGTVEIIYVPKLEATVEIMGGETSPGGPVLDPFLQCDPLPIPVVFQPFIKWGVLSDFLSKEGEANEPERATYAEQRFMEGVELARALLGTIT